MNLGIEQGKNASVLPTNWRIKIKKIYNFVLIILTCICYLLSRAYSGTHRLLVAYSIWCYEVVTYLSTEQDNHCLTSVISTFLFTKLCAFWLVGLLIDFNGISTCLWLFYA